MAPSTMKVHAAIAKALKHQGVDTLFGVMGDGNLYVIDSFVRDHKGKFIAAAHEAGATLMALGFSSVSGKIGVASVTHGPGLVNSMTALVEGAKAALPMVLLCGDTAQEETHHHQNVPQREMVTPTGAGFEQLRAPATLSEDVANAFRRAAIERRPIVLNMPAEFQWLDVEYKPVRYRVPEHRPIAPSGTDLDDAIGVIASAKRPIIVAGRGAIGARDALLRLSKRLDAPVAVTLKAKGLFQDEPANLGIFGTLSTSSTVDAILQSDCIVAFGASLNRRTTSDGTYVKGKRVIHISLDPLAIGKHMASEVGLVGDAEQVADTIAHWLDEAEIPPSGFLTELNGKINAAYPDDVDPRINSDDGTVDIKVALRHLNAAVPRDRVVVTDAGRYTGQAYRLMDVPDPKSYVFTVNFGSIGLGLPYAIGAATASPDRPTVIVIGDGGFMLGGLVEFNSAVRCKADLIVIVCNDGSYGSEHVQFRNKGMDPSTSQFVWPDFAPVATALGGTGITVRSFEDLEAAAATIRNRQSPVLIDVKLNPDRIPPLR